MADLADVLDETRTAVDGRVPHGAIMPMREPIREGLHIDG